MPTRKPSDVSTWWFVLLGLGAMSAIVGAQLYEWDIRRLPTDEGPLIREMKAEQQRQR